MSVSHDAFLKLCRKAELEVLPFFDRVRDIAEHNTAKVLDAFREGRVSDACFAGSTGYGYNDRGRETLDRVFADIFGAEDAIVRAGFANGTHAIMTALFAVLRPGDRLLSVYGPPYDTLLGGIGITGSYPGSLKDFGVTYSQAEPGADGGVDLAAVRQKLTNSPVKAAFIQRSRGYSARPALGVAEIGDIIAFIKSVSPQTVVIVDNCYGEFTEKREPAEVGADLIAGSLIKNPGGGIAPSGGYIAGKREYVEAAADRFIAPGIGREVGSTLGVSRQLYQGLFMAPHTVGEAVKTAVFCASLMKLMSYPVSPLPDEERYDIIQSISFGAPEPLKRFCRGIQKGSPVDAFVTPEPWEMPGYGCQVIMAAGTFIQGASIELSCDAPMREPYTAYMQGGLTYESGKYGVITAAREILEL